MATEAMYVIGTCERLARVSALREAWKRQRIYLAERHEQLHIPITRCVGRERPGAHPLLRLSADPLCLRRHVQTSSEAGASLSRLRAPGALPARPHALRESKGSREERAVVRPRGQDLCKYVATSLLVLPRLLEFTTLVALDPTESVSRLDDDSTRPGLPRNGSSSPRAGAAAKSGDGSHGQALASRGNQGVAAARKLHTMLDTYKSKNAFPPLSLDVPVRQRLDRALEEDAAQTAAAGGHTARSHPHVSFARRPEPPAPDLGSPRATPSPARARILGLAFKQKSAKLEALFRQESESQNTMNRSTRE